MLIGINVGIESKLIKKLNKNLFNLFRSHFTYVSSVKLFILQFYIFKFQVASLFVKLQNEKNEKKFVLLEQLFHNSIQQNNRFPNMKFKLNFYRDIHKYLSLNWDNKKLFNTGNLLEIYLFLKN